LQYLVMFAYNRTLATPAIPSEAQKALRSRS